MCIQQGNNLLFSQATQRSFFSMPKKEKTLKLYQTLEVDQNASQQEVKKSFFRLAKKYHPDVNKDKNAQARYVEINE